MYYYAVLEATCMCCGIYNIHVHVHVHVHCTCIIWSTAAFEYLKSHPMGEVDDQEFSQYCGVGVVISPDQIEEQVYMYTCMYICTACTCMYNSRYMYIR